MIEIFVQKVPQYALAAVDFQQQTKDVCYKFGLVLRWDKLASSAHFGLGFKKLCLAVVTFKRGSEYVVNARIGRNRAHEV